MCCLVLQSNFALLLTIQFASLISSLINIISLLVTSFNSAVTLKLKCGKVVCVELSFSRDRSSVAYRATENLSRSWWWICWIHRAFTLGLRRWWPSWASGVPHQGCAALFQACVKWVLRFYSLSPLPSGFSPCWARSVAILGSVLSSLSPCWSL